MLIRWLISSPVAVFNKSKPGLSGFATAIHNWPNESKAISGQIFPIDAGIISLKL